jgi:ribose-phosphate pyrophosphokinase
MRPNNGAIKLVAGNSNPALADAIAAYLATPLTKAVVRRFADMEIFVEIQENVRGSDVFVIQSTSFPANDHLMELLIIIDFGYARQDRKPGPRTPISAKLVSNLITRAGADRVMTLDLHAGQIQGFFDIPTDNLYAAPMMVRDIKERFDIGKVMVVSPDVGGVGRARGLAKRINAPLAIVDKRRERAGESEVMNVIGEVDGCWRRARPTSTPTSPTACCPAARSPASPRRGSRSWSSPTRSSPPRRSGSRAISAPCRSPP